MFFGLLYAFLPGIYKGLGVGFRGFLWILLHLNIYSLLRGTGVSGGLRCR